MLGLILQPMPANSYWTDSDNDGIPEEIANPPEGDSWWADDSDGDGMTNAEEVIFLSDPYRLDSDFDGLTDRDERDLTPPVLFGGLAPTDPWDWDSNDNGYSDHDEYFYALQGRALDVNYSALTSALTQFYSYSDADGDGVHNQDDSDPLTMDRDGDGIVNWQDSYMDDASNGSTAPPSGPAPDSDADGIPNDSDPFPWGSYTYAGVEYGGSWVDADSDGVPDPADPFPNGSYTYGGSEYEGAWSDRDNDGIPDPADAFPDGSYVWNNVEYEGNFVDSDNDGIPDEHDAFPNGSYWYNATEYAGAWVDNDNDGIPNSHDYFPDGSYLWNGMEYGGYWVDQDGDGIPDSFDPFPTLSGSYWFNGTEYGGTWTDADSDGVPDPADPFPNGSYWYGGVEYGGTWTDSDQDGIPDGQDAFPNGSYTYNGVEYGGLWSDVDSDGVPDPADPFPGTAYSHWYNGTEYPGYWSDQDGDGIPDSADIYTNDPTQGTGWQYNGQWFTTPWVDRDSDGVPDQADSWPDDPENGLDSDGDGLDNYTERTATHTDPDDVDSDDDYLTDHEEAMIFHTNPLGARSADPEHLELDGVIYLGLDSDNDGLPDIVEDHYAALGHGMSKANPADAGGDLDADGYTNLQAFQAGRSLTANLNQYDQDGDGMTDAVEDYWAAIVPGLLSKTIFADAVGDPDNDGLFNFEETGFNLSPVAMATPLPDGSNFKVSYWTRGLVDDGDGGQIEGWVLSSERIAEDRERAQGLANVWTWPPDPDTGAVVVTDDSTPFNWPVPSRLAAGDWDADGMPDIWEYRHALALRDDTDAGPSTGFMPPDPAAPDYSPPPEPDQASFMITVTEPDGSTAQQLNNEAFQAALGAWIAAKAAYDQSHATSMASWNQQHAQWLAQDPDHDTLSNRRECLLGTHPRIADSDGDGIHDGLEVQAGTSPCLRSSAPPLVLSIFAGQDQSAIVGKLMPIPLIVRATQAGMPRAGASISFAVSSGGAGGSFGDGTTASTLRTNPAGIAGVSFRAGASVGTTTITASSGPATVSFTAATLPEPPAGPQPNPNPNPSPSPSPSPTPTPNPNPSPTPSPNPIPSETSPFVATIKAAYGAYTEELSEHGVTTWTYDPGSGWWPYYWGLPMSEGGGAVSFTGTTPELERSTLQATEADTTAGLAGEVTGNGFSFQVSSGYSSHSFPSGGAGGTLDGPPLYGATHLSPPNWTPPGPAAVMVGGAYRKTSITWYGGEQAISVQRAPETPADQTLTVLALETSMLDDQPEGQPAVTIITIPAGSDTGDKTITSRASILDSGKRLVRTVTLLPVEFEVKHTEIDPATGQVVNPGTNTMLRDEIVDIKIKVPPIGTTDWTVDLTVEPEAMRNESLPNRGNVQMYDFGQVETSGTVTPDKTQFVLQASSGGERTIKAVFNKEGKLKIKMKSTDGKLDFTSPEYTIQKRIRKYANLPSNQSHDLNQHDKAFIDAAAHWGGVYQHEVDDVERLKAMGMAESELGITDATDILTVGNAGDHVLDTFRNVPPYDKFPSAGSALREVDVANNSTRMLSYPAADETPAPTAIHWGVCWLYQKASSIQANPNPPQPPNPPNPYVPGPWRSWDTATERYNGGGVPNYLQRINRAMKEGRHPSSTTLYIWPVKSNKKARGNQ